MRLIFLFLLMFSPALLKAQDTGFSGAVQEVLADDSYQKELPCITDRESNKTCGPRKINMETPGWLKALGDFFSFLAPLGKALPYLFWGGLILLAGYLLYHLFSNFEWRGGKMRKKAKAKKIPRAAPVVSPRPEEVRAPTLPEADALAETGDFSAAVHFLLLAGIDLLQRKLRGLLAVSETSRELLSHQGLSEAQKSHLLPLIQFVEISLFAGRGLTREEYDRCRQSFLALQNAPGSGS